MWLRFALAIKPKIQMECIILVLENFKGIRNIGSKLKSDIILLTYLYKLNSSRREYGKI